MSAITHRRVARQSHRCGDCGNRIAAGDVYLTHLRFPDEINTSDKPWRIKECARCAIRYGRTLELDPVPYEQCAREGLL